MAGIYIRISKEDANNKEESESITNQRNLIKDYISKTNYVIFKEYVDDGFSGTTFDRPSFNQMINDIESGNINMVVTKDMSRLGRDYIESGYYIEKYFVEKGVRYIAINDHVDTYFNNENSDYVPFKAILNDLYAKDISKKIKSSIITKKKMGLFLGPLAPYGYKKDPLNKYKLIIDKKVYKNVIKIYNLFIKGNSVASIAHQLTKKGVETPSVYKNIEYKNNSKTRNIWDPKTILEILKNPNYTGDLVQNRRKKLSYKLNKIVNVNEDSWIVCEKTHEPIISRNTFMLVQSMFKNNKNIYEGNNILLKGLLICKECNHKLGINKSGDGKRHYTICNYYKKYSKYNLCTCHSMRYEKIEKMVIENITMMLNIIKTEEFNQIINKDKNVDLIKNKIKILEEKNKKLLNNIEQMYIDKLNNYITLELYKKVHNKINDDIIKNNKKIKLLNSKYISEKKVINNDEYIKTKISQLVQSISFINNVIDKITIDEQKNIEVYYKINLY